MIWWQIIFIGLAGATSSNIPQLETWKGYQEGDRYFYFPGEDGVVFLVDVGEDGDVERGVTGYGDSDDVGYWLYTRSNPNEKQVLKMVDERSVNQSYFDPSKITVVISHGWRNSGNSSINRVLKKVFLNDSDVNVIVFDWGAIAHENYITAKSAVARLGKILGQFIDWLQQDFQLSLEKVHLVGHSLGAHLVGNAGNQLNGDVKRITALDPAGPLWYSDKHRVSSHDALYVEVIHTNAFTCGYPLPSGHSDHYPNGGKHMPGCGDLDVGCHHSRSWRYLAASVEHDQFIAHQCTDLNEVFNDECDGDVGNMGNSDISKEQYGVYRVNTKPEYPYV